MTILDRILREKENEVLKLLQNPPEKSMNQLKDHLFLMHCIKINDYKSLLR